jgi:hypothetical protein
MLRIADEALTQRQLSVRPPASSRRAASASRAVALAFALLAFTGAFAFASDAPHATYTRAVFKAQLFKYPGAGGWTFAQIPANHTVPATHPWGRTPVFATVDGKRWSTSVWRDKRHGTLLPVPAKIRGGKEHGDTVDVILEPRGLLEAPTRRATARTRTKNRRDV